MQHKLSDDCVPGTILDALHVLIHLIPTTVQPAKYCNFTHFMDKKQHRLNNLLKHTSSQRPVIQ